MISIRLISPQKRMIFLCGWLFVLLTACSGSRSQGQQASATPFFQTTVTTSDKLFLIQFNVTPDQLGTNTFTVVAKNTNGSSLTQPLTVRLTTTMLDMDMGTGRFNLQSDGKSKYSGQGELAMSGKWQIGIELQTPDHTLHKAIVQLKTAS